MDKALTCVTVVSIERALAAPRFSCPPADAGTRVIKI
jgi:crotonobetainyl-CoA:carnitine CoA-transferase CaiB-like acyl-CoA transferase